MAGELLLRSEMLQWEELSIPCSPPLLPAIQPWETLCLEPSHLIPLSQPAHGFTESGLSIWEVQQEVNKIQVLQLYLVPHLTQPAPFSSHRAMQAHTSDCFSSIAAGRHTQGSWVSAELDRLLHLPKVKRTLSLGFSSPPAKPGRRHYL